MESGVIALVDGPNSLSEVHESIPFENNAPFTESERCIEIRSESTLETGEKVFQGRAAVEEISEKTVTDIQSDGTISSVTEQELSTKYTEFVCVPDHFLAVENNSGKFLFQMLNTYTEHTVRPVNLNLDDFLKIKEDPMIWKLGFEQRGENAENGVVHGRDVLEDQEVGQLLDFTNKNQIGIDYNYRSENIKAFLAKSGYVEVYQPNNYDSNDFAQFVVDEVIEFGSPK